jgi:hypothetical protein
VQKVLDTLLIFPRLFSPNGFGGPDSQVDKFAFQRNDFNHHMVANAKPLTNLATDVIHPTLPQG